MLPKHLYIDSTDPDGTVTKVTIAPDKLLVWSEGGRGDAVDKWCKQICDKKIVAISTWEDNRILQLEDDWVSSENDVEQEDEDEEEEHYHLACEVVSRDAEMKREVAREQMAEHKTAIEKLVRQAKASNAAYTPPPQESHLAKYLIAVGIGIVMGIAVAYVLFT